MHEESGLNRQDFASAVIEKAREYFPKCDTEDLKQFIEDTFPYLDHCPSLVDDIDNCFNAVKAECKMEYLKNRNASAMDLEKPSNKAFIDRAFKKLSEEKLKKVNRYAAAPKAEDANQQQSAEIVKTSTMSFKILQHKEAYKGPHVLKSTNEALNFSKSVREDFILVTPKIRDGKPKNFLYHKPQDFIQTFTAGYERMEKLANQYLPRLRQTDNSRDKDLSWYQIHRVSKDQNTISEEALILARLTLDDDGEFNVQKLLAEVLDSKNHVRDVYLNFSTVSPDSRQQLFPNMYAILAVEGSLVDENTPLRVNRIIELDSDQDKLDDLQAKPRAPKRHLTVLVFKGPYTLNGNAYFGVFEMVRLHVREHNPNLVVLIGPFVPEDQTTEASELKLLGSYQHVRDENIGNFKKMLFDAGVRCDIALVPDQAEADNFYPTPLPAAMQVDLKAVRQNPNDMSKPTILSSPCLIELKAEDSSPVTLAITSQDFIRNCIAKFHTYSKGKKYLDTLKSVLSQQHLHPAYPMPYAFDVTQQEKLWLAQKPDVWVCPSSIISFAEVARGCIVVNPKSVMNGDDYGSFARLQIDTDRASSDLPARDRVKAEVLQF